MDNPPPENSGQKEKWQRMTRRAEVLEEDMIQLGLEQGKSVNSNRNFGAMTSRCGARGGAGPRGGGAAGGGARQRQEDKAACAHCGTHSHDKEGHNFAAREKHCKAFNKKCDTCKKSRAFQGR